MNPQRRLPHRCAAVLAWASMGLSTTALAQGVATPPAQNVMTLGASATVDVALDLLAITFSTTREGPDAGVVQTQLKQALEGALTEARKVAKPGQIDVRTGNFALMPRYAAKGSVTGWQGSAQLHVEGRDMPAISQLAGRIQTLSIAQVRQGLSREARERAETETTAQAIARFRERAQAQAQLFGFTGFSIREVSVGLEGVPSPAPVMAMRASAAMAADAPLPVEGGKTTITSSVNGSVQMLK
jgi:predicted secreted protein